MNCLLRTVNRLDGKALAVCAFLMLSVLCTQAQDKLSPQQVKALKKAYDKMRSPELSFQHFSELNGHIYAREGGDAGTLAVSTFCTKTANSWCDTFETGLNQTQYTGGYGTYTTDLHPNPFTGTTYGFSSGAINLSTSHQTIINKSAGNDPITGIPTVPTGGGNQSLRLGNYATGAEFELIGKTIVVSPDATILNFSYAVVFQDPGHDSIDQPAFTVRVYDCATGLELSNVCNLGNGKNVVVSDANNPFFQSLSGGSIAYRNWSQGQINLSAHIGKTIIVIFTNKDCNLGGHYGYTYLDNLLTTQCSASTPPPPYYVSLDTVATSTCGVGKICAKYQLPTANSITGSVNIALDIYQNGTNTKLATLNSGVLTSGSSYCFNINPATLGGINTSLAGFDFTFTGTFVLSGFSLAPYIDGNPPNGKYSGSNNDYLVQCGGPVYYSKSTGDLHNIFTWGLNPDGSGSNPSDFNDSVFQLANRPSGLYIMTADWAVNGGTVNIPSGAQLQINGFTFSISQLAGPGTLSGSATSNLVVIGTAGGNIPLSFTSSSNMLNNITVNRMGTSATATLGNALNVMNIMTLTNGTLNTGGFLTLKSSAANTARVAPVTGAISGNVVVERYIPSRRAWRILSAPVGGTQTINACWQEGAILGSSATPNPVPGFGTHITGGPIYGFTANGFDQNPGAMSSIKTYSSSLNTWVDLSNTNSTAINTNAYMTFVRGDRGIPIGLNTVSSTATTLRATGPLKVGDQTFAVSGSGFTAIPNPFASPINFATLTRTGVQNNFYVWDPKMGGDFGVGAYVLLSDNGMGGYTITPAPVSPESQYIQSGQGFLVAASVSGTPGSITINESDKSATAATDVFRVTGGSTAINNAPKFVDANSGQGWRITLKTTAPDASLTVLDEVLVSYHSIYKASLDNLDAVKMDNIQENLGTVHDGQVLMVERKPLPREGDAIALKFWNTKAQTYVLEVNPMNLAGTGLSAWLEDKYLNTSTPIDISKKSQFSFTVTSNPVSARTDRFRIVIGKGLLDALTINKSGIVAYPNPISNHILNLAFAGKAQGAYQVTVSNGSGQVLFRKSIQHPGATASHAVLLPAKFGRGVYQVRVSGSEDETSFSISIN